MLIVQGLFTFCDKFGILKQPSSSSQSSAERSMIFALIKVSSIPLSSCQNRFPCPLRQDFQKLFYCPLQKVLLEVRFVAKPIRNHWRFSLFPTYRLLACPTRDNSFRCRCTFVLKCCVRMLK